MSSLVRVLKNRALTTLMFGHFTNDMFAGILPMLYPLMKDRFHLDNAAVGLVTLAYTSASSLTQPVFGYFSDRFGRKWIAPATLLWGSGFVAAYGFASSYAMFIVLAALAGIGSGAYHPLGASNAAAISDEQNRNASMSLYTVGGTCGWALGPLVAVVLLSLFGAHGTAVVILFGVAAGGLLQSQMHRVELARRLRTTNAVRTVTGGESARWGVLARVMGVVMLRSWVMLAVLQFIPIWYDDLGYERRFYGPLVTIIILAGAVGTLLGGALADRIGQRLVITGSLVLAVPPLLLFAGLPGPLAFGSGIVLGLLADASLSVTLVAAQRMLPGQVGMASGVILGLGFVTGGIGVPVTGKVADAVGIDSAMMLLSLLCVAAAALALTIPRDALDAKSASQVPGPIGRESTGERPLAVGGK